MNLLSTEYFLWPQRCACHGGSLLSADITKLPYFKPTLAVMLKLISCVNNHGFLSDLLLELGGLFLFRPALTRMCKLVIAAERVLEDRKPLGRMFHGNKMYEYLRSNGATVDLLTSIDDEQQEKGVMLTIQANIEHIKDNCFSVDDKFFQTLKLFNYCQSPILTLHRFHDVDFKTSNLSGSVLAFWKCRKWIKLMPEPHDINTFQLIDRSFEVVRKDLLKLV
jgi:hypothetical protein